MEGVGLRFAGGRGARRCIVSSTRRCVGMVLLRLLLRWFGGGGWSRARFRSRFCPTRLLLLGLPAGQFCLCLVVTDIEEHLHSSRKLLGGEDSVFLVDEQARRSPELPGQLSVPSHPDQQLTLGREALDPVLNC